MKGTKVICILYFREPWTIYWKLSH